MRISSNNFLTIIIFVGLLGLSLATNAQEKKKIQPSQMAKVTQFIGNDTEITFTFSRPGVKDREVWGGLVPYGLEPGNKYSNNKPFPWRAGANANSTVEVNKDVKVEGKSLPAGKYSIHMIPSEKENWVVIFNKVNDLWGSYKYDQTQDALRVAVSPVEASFEEWLNYGFGSITESSAVAYLHWEKLQVPFKIEIAD